MFYDDILKVLKQQILVRILLGTENGVTGLETVP